MTASLGEKNISIVLISDYFSVKYLQCKVMGVPNSDLLHTQQDMSPVLTGAIE